MKHNCRAGLESFRSLLRLRLCFFGPCFVCRRGRGLFAFIAQRWLARPAFLTPFQLSSPPRNEII